MANLKPIIKTNFHRGMSTAASYLVGDGLIRDGLNLRFDDQSGFVRRNRTKFVKALVGVDPANTYAKKELDDYLCMIGDDSASGVNVIPQIYDGDGVAVTIQRTGVITFDQGDDGTGDPRGYEVGDIITKGAGTAVIRSVILDRGIADANWTAGTATGQLDIRVTAGTWPEATGAITNSTDATVTGNQTAYAEVDYTYLGSDMTTIRMFSIEKSILVWNTATTCTYKADPGDASDVDGEVQSWDKLQRRYSAVVGEVRKTLTAEHGFPVGYYECYEVGDEATRTAPKWRRVPKPGQTDALIEDTTWPHRLIKISDSVFAWETPPWAPRLSGGDVEGVNPVTGEETIRNAPLLQDLTIIDINVYMGKLSIFASDKSEVLSQSGQFFNTWLNDIHNTVASDRIEDQVVGQNTGDPQFSEPVGGVLFVQCAHKQFQYGAGDEVLVAGGENTPYNGRFRKRGDFEGSATVAPVSSGEVLFMLDSNQNVIAFRDQGMNIGIVGVPTDEVFDDITSYTPTRLEFVNRTLYVLTSEGLVWSYRVGGVNDDGIFGAWARGISMTEAVEHIWGSGNDVRILTSDSTEFTILTYTDEDQPLSSGFTFNEHLDRYEDVTGVYSAADDETTFAVNTTLGLTDCELHIRGNVSKLVFDTGDFEPSAGEAILGGSSGAAGTIIRYQNISGTEGGGDLKGRVWINKSNSIAFTDNEVLTIDGTIRTNLADGADESVIAKAEIRTPTSITTGGSVVFAGYLGGMAHRIGRLFTSSAKQHRLWPGMDRRDLTIKGITVFYERTTDFRIRQARDGREEDKLVQFTSKKVGTVLHGESPVKTGRFWTDVAGDARSVDITIESSSSGPFRVGAIAYETEIAS